MTQLFEPGCGMPLVRVPAKLCHFSPLGGPA